ncbi:MAG: DNA primase [Burkholderiales bacterium]|nr:DNA primase [Burkholderiales bacterium]
MIPESFKQELLDRVDIVALVSRYVKLRRSGANYLGLCPFHAEKTPSFTVSPAKQFYHCFGCGAHGNAIGFLMAYSGLGYVEAVKALAESAGLRMPERAVSPQAAARRRRETELLPLLERALAFYRAALKDSPRAIGYLKTRGVSGETATRYRLGYAPPQRQALREAFADYDAPALVAAGLVIEAEGRRYDRFRDRIMFPIHDARGAVVGFGGRVIGEGEPKYLNSPETAVFQKGRELYGLLQAREAIRAAGRAIVVEGYMDVLALAQHGVGCAVATLGTATTPAHVSRLLQLADEVVFCFDGDAAGRKAAWRALEVSLPLAADGKTIRFLFLPEGEDPDSFVRARGGQAFERMVGAAQPLSAYLLAELQAGLELSSAEGRSRLVARAAPLLQRIGGPVLRLQIGREVARLAGLAPGEVERLVAAPGAAAARRAAPQRAPALAVSQERNLLRCVLSKPALLERVEPELLDPALPESAVLRALREEPAAGARAAVLVERFRGSAFEPVVADAMAAAIDAGLDESAVEEEFAQIVLALRIRRKQEEVRALTERVKLEPALAAELNRRVRELHELKAQRA